MTIEQMIKIARHIHYKDWWFQIARDGDSIIWLQARFLDTNKETHHARKWLLSTHMTESELVQTCFKAVLTAEEHEAREAFLYRGRAVYGPHISVNALFNACETLDIRPCDCGKSLYPNDSEITHLPNCPKSA